MNEHELKKGIAFLAEAGLNLFAVLDCAALPERTEKAMLAAGVPLADYARLILIGHGGRRLWNALQEWGMKTADPVDYYSTTIARQFIHEILHDPPTLWLYPFFPEHHYSLDQIRYHYRRSLINLRVWRNKR